MLKVKHEPIACFGANPLPNMKTSWLLLGLLLSSAPLPGQTLLNVDFGVGSRSSKTGFAATGQTTNDFWNLYRHYDPKFVPGAPLVSDGLLRDLKLADGAPTSVSVAVSNAPGAWGNSTGDPMYDSYIFANNGSNMTVTVQNLEAGHYHFYLYGHADPDVIGEQNSSFMLRSDTNALGPLAALGASGWKAGALWQERYQYVVFRDVPVLTGKPVIIEVAPGPNGIAVLNGLQISSRGTSPPRLAAPAATKIPATLTNLVFHEVRYDGAVSDSEARFQVKLSVESLGTNEVSAPLFEGDVAVLAPELPEGLRIASTARQYRLVATTPGSYKLDLELIAKITKAEPWNQISFTGPAAALASVRVQATNPGVDIQLLSGTQLDSGAGLRPAPPGVSPPKSDAKASPSPVILGFLGIDRTLSLRWQSKTAEVARKSLITVDTLAVAQVTPTVIKYTTELRYEILQSSVPALSIALPLSHALTKVQGEQIRDWNVKTEGERQLLTIDLVKPVEKAYHLVLLSEQTLDAAPSTAQIAFAQALGVERESGSLSLAAEDMLVDVDSVLGLRQVNASSGALAAYRFYGRPASLTARLRHTEPLLKVADRVTARLEETRLLISHVLTVNVEKAGIYLLELTPQAGFSVSDVRGDGIEDWKAADGRIRVNFSSRVLDSRQLHVQLEQALKSFPDTITISPLRVTAATNETAVIGAAAALGLRVKTAELTDVRELPVDSLSPRSDELLAFRANQPDWKVTLAAERLPARMVADIFDLITIGDGLVGGSATIRYGLINQGVQEFKVNLPSHWKNVEFTGPNIRRKELTAVPPAQGQAANYVLWTIALQDKAWGGYTLVITYDYQFDPKKASLNLAGAHAVGVEREAGSIAVTTAASLKLEPKSIESPLHVVDPTELDETDRALITRPVLLAYRYSGASYQLTLDALRQQQVDVLDAVADRTQITSVLTGSGEMLTQASFMVKNNDKQFQKFRLPAGASLWGCSVNTQPVKAEMDKNWLAVSLPRGANRDEPFSADIVYKQKIGALEATAFPKSLQIAAPKTDVPNTYAEWEIYVPPTHRFSRFGGNMTVLRGTTYGFHDAWQEFTEFYSNLFRESGGAILGFGVLAVLIIALIGGAVREGWSGVGFVLGVFLVISILAAMLLPALAKAKAKAAQVNAVSNLKQIGLAALTFANDNGGRLPVSFEEMKNELGDEKIRIDPATGQQFIYSGAGKDANSPSGILAYSPTEAGGRRVVCFMDGSVMQMSSVEFAQALQRDATAGAQANMLAAQGDAVRQQQARTAPGGAANAPASPGTSQPSGVQAPLGAVPVAGGIRSLHLEIPRTGQSFTFTKVLNVSDEPLSVKMSLINYKWFRFWRSLLQLATFIGGLLLLWRQWQRMPRSSFRMTVGLALAMGSFSSLLISVRVLHFALILGAPTLLLALLIWLTWRYWPRKRHGQTAPEGPILGPDSTNPGAVPPAIASIALLFFMSQATTCQAQNGTAEALPNPTNAFSITSGAYAGTVGEKVAQFDATLLISTFATNQTIPLFGNDVAIEEFSTRSAGAKLVRQGNKVALRLEEVGAVTVQFKVLMKLTGEVTRRELAFAIPPALSSKLAITITEPEADVEFPTAISFKRTPDQQETRVEAILGAGERVELFWTPRVKRVAEMASSIFVLNSTLVTIGGGVINTHSTLDYQIAQGELRQAKLRLPAGHRLLRVEGDWIRTWELSDDADAQLLTVDLVKSIPAAYRLAVETEKVLETLPAQSKIEIVSARDVIRETGLVGIRSGEELSVSVEGGPDLQRIDGAEFAKHNSGKTEGLIGAYHFLKPDFQLLTRAEVIQPQVEAIARNAIRIGFDQVDISTRIDYTIKKAGVFLLRVALPAGYKVETVTGSNVLHWSERSEPRLLEVALKERVTGAFPLNITLVKPHKELPKTLDVVGASPLDTQKLSGFVSVISEPGISIKTTLFDGLVEIPAASLDETARASAGSSSVLAYKAVGADAQAVSPWRLAVATEVVDSWVRAEIANLVSISDTLVSGRTVVRYEIMNAPLKEFRLRVPPACANIEISGANIRRRDQNGAEWRVELQNKVRGTYTLTVNWEQTHQAGATNVLQFTGIQAPGVERETGYVIFLTLPPLQIVERSATEELIKIDLRELPDWAGISTGPSSARSEVPVLAYRYLRPGYQVALEARRFEEAAILQALVDSVHLTTVVADDGQMMTELSLAIRNNGLQHLELQMPNNTKVWSAFVAGQPVRPSQHDGKLLLPLERSGGDDTPITVELTYAGLDKFPRTRGEVSLASPQLGAPLKNARWDVYLPPDFGYSKFNGSMTHDADAALAVQVFSSREYREQEQQKRAARKSEAQSFLTNARNLLASGKVQNVNEDYQRLNSVTDAETRKELESLKKDLTKANGGNLIQAQRAYTVENNRKYNRSQESSAGGFGGGSAAPAQQAAQAAELVHYDADVAERQWEVLQKAQEVSVSKIQPLRVNLPTRGQRHSFSQVLQTEVNKAMTIHFQANNTKEVGWAKTALYGLSAFLLLWIVVACLGSRQKHVRA